MLLLNARIVKYSGRSIFGIFTSHPNMDISTTYKHPPLRAPSLSFTHLIFVFEINKKNLQKKVFRIKDYRVIVKLFNCLSVYLFFGEGDFLVLQSLLLLFLSLI